jgi:hypothetical protein
MFLHMIDSRQLLSGVGAVAVASCIVCCACMTGESISSWRKEYALRSVRASKVLYHIHVSGPEVLDISFSHREGCRSPDEWEAQAIANHKSDQCFPGRSVIGALHLVSRLPSGAVVSGGGVPSLCHMFMAKCDYLALFCI